MHISIIMWTCITAFMSICVVSSTELGDDHQSELNAKVRNIVETILNERRCKSGAGESDIKSNEEIEHLQNSVTSMGLELAQQSRTIHDLQNLIQNLQNVGLTRLDRKIVNDNDSSTRANIVSAQNDYPTIGQSMSVEKLIRRGRRVRRAVGGSVAFSAYLTATNSHTVVGQAIKFDQVLLNDGHGYNKYTGAFTAPLSGVYLFSFHFDARKLTFIRLVVNGVNQVDAVANAHTNVESRHSQSMGGNTAIVHVGHGQAVLVETYEVADGETASSDTFRLCTFSGVLLY